MRGAAASPYGAALPYTPADISPLSTGGSSATNRSKRRPSMPTTSTLSLTGPLAGSLPRSPTGSLAESFTGSLALATPS